MEGFFLVPFTLTDDLDLISKLPAVDNRVGRLKTRILCSFVLYRQLNVRLEDNGMRPNHFKPQCDCRLTSWPVSSTQSLEHCFLASISTLNMVQTDGATRKSVDLLAFCILASNADFVLWGRTQRGFCDGCCPK